MTQTNRKIREAAKSRGVYLWQVAERYGIADTNFSKKLRTELPPDETNKMLQIIDEIAKDKEDGQCGE